MDPYSFENMGKQESSIEPGTILVSHNRYYLGGDGTLRLTLAHEIVHWAYHQYYFRMLSVLNTPVDSMNCDVEPDLFSETLSPLQKAHWLAEWQANALAIRIAMPEDLVLEAYEEILKKPKIVKFTGEKHEDIVKRLAKLFDVPLFVAKQRLRQLGYGYADGTCLHVDNRLYAPFSWENEDLLTDQHLTFILDQKGHDALYEQNTVYKKLIDSGRFIYIGYVTCINNPKYVNKEYGKFCCLTGYAREHADECCLIFTWNSKSFLKDQYEFYGQSYLSNALSANDYIAYSFDSPDNVFKIIGYIPKNDIQYDDDPVFFQKYFDYYESVSKAINNLEDQNFGGLLYYHMKRKSITFEKLEASSRLSVTTIKNYIKNKSNPPLENVMAIIAGLELEKFYCESLIKAAGLSINEKTFKGIIYKALIESKSRDIVEWNKELKRFQLPTIPNHRGQ